MLRVVYAGQPAGLDAVRDALGAHASVVDVPETLEAVSAALPTADVYFATMKVRLDADLIASAPHLELVVSPTTGSDHVDLTALERPGSRSSA